MVIVDNKKEEGRDLNLRLKSTVKLLLFFGWLWILLKIALVFFVLCSGNLYGHGKIKFAALQQ